MNYLIAGSKQVHIMHEAVKLSKLPNSNRIIPLSITFVAYVDVLSILSTDWLTVSKLPWIQDSSLPFAISHFPASTTKPVK